MVWSLLHSYINIKHIFPKKQQNKMKEKHMNIRCRRNALHFYRAAFQTANTLCLNNLNVVLPMLTITFKKQFSEFSEHQAKDKG